jgi:hypothetical protein
MAALNTDNSVQDEVELYTAPLRPRQPPPGNPRCPPSRPKTAHDVAAQPFADVTPPGTIFRVPGKPARRQASAHATGRAMPLLARGRARSSQATLTTIAALPVEPGQVAGEHERGRGDLRRDDAGVEATTRSTKGCISATQSRYVSNAWAGCRECHASNSDRRRTDLPMSERLTLLLLPLCRRAQWRGPCRGRCAGVRAASAVTRPLLRLFW